EGVGSRLERRQPEADGLAGWDRLLDAEGRAVELLGASVPVRDHEHEGRAGFDPDLVGLESVRLNRERDLRWCVGGGDRAGNDPYEAGEEAGDRQRRTDHD